MRERLEPARLADDEGLLALAPGVDDPVPREAREVGQRDVRRHRQEQHEPLDPPLARDIADACVQPRPGSRNAAPRRRS